MLPHFDFISLFRINSHLDQKEPEEDGEQTKKGRGRGKKDMDSDDDFDNDFGDLEDEDDEDFDSDSGPKKTQDKSATLPDVSRVSVKDWKQQEGSCCTKWT